ncbi:twin-arginine translocation pathway signal protein [Rhodobacteraceae bacterium CCMM004]|nr:twin-arginine translocation pathway signal protein [Rhodobacteraceae bacterium CCMM004]
MSEKDTGASRRDFLRLSAVSAPAAVAAATLGGQAAAQETAAEDDGRIKDTAHTRAYFDSARF